MKIGIIGAENSHSVHIAKIINAEKLIGGFSVDYIWGETKEFAEKAAQEGQIPNIVTKTEKMLGKIDALIVDHRHPAYHLQAAMPFIRAGVPTFIDKPFCYRVKEGKKFLEIAKKHKTPITSFSVIPNQKSFQDFCESIKKDAGDILAGRTYGPCDIKSKWGGIFFYGVHQVEMVLKAFGYNVSKVLVVPNGNGSTGQIIYNDGKILTMDLIKEGCKTFGISVIGREKIIHAQIVYDKSQYLSGIKKFTTMFETGQEPEKYENMLMPVAVLEALEKSVKSKKIERVVI